MNARGKVVISCRAACERCARAFTGETWIDRDGKIHPEIKGLWTSVCDYTKTLYCQNCIFHPDVKKKFENLLNHMWLDIGGEG